MTKRILEKKSSFSHFFKENEFEPGKNVGRKDKEKERQENKKN